MKVAILGCGPSGLLACHAAILQDHQPVVYSIATKSEMPGTMYLHRPIPQLTPEEPDGMITYRKWGDKREYAFKVYKDFEAACSWDQFIEGEVPAWSMRRMYDDLWSRYSGLIRNQQLDPMTAGALVNDYPLVISTVPAYALCRKPYHRFTSAEIWVSSEAALEVQPGEIAYNGRAGDRWYRSCDIFGYQATEFGSFQDGLPRGVKPITTNCDCFDHRMLKVGRFGAWRKGELVHNAFQTTYDRLERAHAVH